MCGTHNGLLSANVQALVYGAGHPLERSGSRKATLGVWARDLTASVVSLCGLSRVL